MNKTEKAHQILVEGRLNVERVGGGVVVAACRGFSGAVYKLGFDPRRKEWRCTCEASAQFRRTCSHLIALQLVTVKPGPSAGEGGST